MKLVINLWALEGFNRTSAAMAENSTKVKAKYLYELDLQNKAPSIPAQEPIIKLIRSPVMMLMTIVEFASIPSLFARQPSLLTAYATQITNAGMPTSAM